jgi:hypothetical protein
MTGYVVEVDAEHVLAQFMTATPTLSEAINEAFRSYSAKGDVKKINLLPEKGKK